MNTTTTPPAKPTGIPWLGDVPAHWEVKRLKDVADVRFSNVDKKTEEGEVPVKLCNYTDVYYGHYLDGTPAYMEASASLSEIARFKLCKGDVLITKDSESPTDIAIAAMVVEDVPDLVCGYHLAMVRVDREQLDPAFLYWQFLSDQVREQYYPLANGITRFALGHGDITGGNFVVPPLPEQRAIAAYLDERTARIDGLIARKQRLVQLLKEKRQALVTRAVTRGLDARVKLKQSGVPWLGEVPEHWGVKRLKYLLKEPLQYGANEAAVQDDPDQPRYIRITDVHENGGLREETFRSLPEEVARPYLLEDGDLLFARSGATVGKTFLYTPSWGRAAYAGYLIRARFDKAVAVARFVQWFTTSSIYWQWLDSNMIQATIQNVSADKYNSLWVPLPPIQEQLAIVHAVQSSLDRIDALITKVDQAVLRLQEYRTALISAAVTGKVRVPVSESTSL